VLNLFFSKAFTQPVMETGGQKMPDEWIDKDTKHKVVRLSRMEGNSNMSFYFHNNPFIGNKMVFYSSSKNDLTGVQKQENYSVNSRNKQLHLLDLKTLKSEQLTFQSSPMNGEIVHEKSGNVYYQIKDSVFSVNAFTKKSQLEYVFPADFKANIHYCEC
jgi:oligogalacturonide lyase